MMNQFDHVLAHEFILIELAIRTLERDRKHIDIFKAKYAMDALFESTIQKALKERIEIKNRMGKIGMSLQEEKRIDEFATDYLFKQRGLTEKVTYSNMALRNHTNMKIQSLFGI
ncbi:MAG: hypothetical protein KBT36_06910 [Kurthia sp.]|nr:hypothetical protein [Candidatus Kurthia equi]